MTHTYNGIPCLPPYNVSKTCTRIASGSYWGIKLRNNLSLSPMLDDTYVDYLVVILLFSLLCNCSMRQLVTTKWEVYPLVENKNKRNIDKRVLVLYIRCFGVTYFRMEMTTC